jgi:hypothetical protein
MTSNSKCTQFEANEDNLPESQRCGLLKKGMKYICCFISLQNPCVVLIYLATSRCCFICLHMLYRFSYVDQ